MKKNVKRFDRIKLAMTLLIVVPKVAFALYPQSLSNAINTFDLVDENGYLYKRSDRIAVICHPVDAEFFTWMLNTDGSPGQYDRARDLFERQFVSSDGIHPVFVVNIRNNGDSTFTFNRDAILIENLETTVLKLVGWKFSEVDILTLPAESEMKLFVYCERLSLTGSKILETFDISLNGLSFDFHNNPAWDFLKRDVLRYQIY